VLISLMLTADCHLKASEPERLEVLRWICKQAAREQAEALLIAGDLFDSSEDGAQLVSEVTSIFDEELPDSFAVVMVAGNHDENLGDLGWPPHVSVLDPYESFDITRDGRTVRIHGLPYLRGESAADLSETCEFHGDGTDILLGHASYLNPDYRYLLSEIEAQNEENAFILFDEDLRDLPFDRVFLGHWHGYQEMGGDPMVTYVGSPLPNSRAETGRKNVMVVEVEGSVLTFTPEDVETPPGWYYEEYETLVMPGYEEDTLGELESSLPEPDPGCDLRVRVEGFIEGDSEGYRRRCQSLLDDRTEDYRNLELDYHVVGAEQFDTPVIDRLLSALREVDPTERLDVSEIVNSSESERIYRTAESLLANRTDEVKRRAEKLMLEAIYGELAE
jgi:DNA repair exonuclease SbcCD nuclease subunit